MINAKHYARTCVVVIKKPKTRLFDDYNTAVTYILENKSIPTADQWSDLREKYTDEERFRLQRFIKSGMLLDFDADDEYFYLIANGSRYRKEKDRKVNVGLIDQTWERAANFNVNTPANERVISVTVNQTTKTAWTASVMLDNTGNIFYLKNLASVPLLPQKFANVVFQENDCVIESNDIIQIYLPDWKDELQLVFTGYINSVGDDDDGVEKRIRLSCEDITKKMSVTRTNAYPSLDPVEAQGDTVTPYEATWMDKSPEEVLKGILGRAFCDVFNDVTLFSEAETALKELNSKEGLTKQIKSFKALNVAIDRKIADSYIDTIKNADGTIIGYKGYKAKKPTSDTGNISVRGELAFIIMGMNQPVWALQMGGGNYDYLISDWRSNDQIINDIAKDTFFEFYAFPSGIVYFGPINLSLPKLYDGNEKEQHTFNTFLKENFYFTQDKEIYVRKFNQIMDDRVIFTDIVITGSYIEGGFTYEFLKKLVIAPYKYRRKFGVRMMAQESKVGLVTPESLEVYGEQRLWRQNSKFYTASLFLEGNSNLQPGIPCYVDRWTSVYYISEVTHSFIAGADYSTDIELTYRRKPIFVLKNGKGSLNSYLTSLVQKQEMSKREKNFIIENTEDLTWGKIKLYVDDSTFIYIEGKIVWDAIPIHLYPSSIQVNEYLKDYVSIRSAEIKKEYEQKLSITKSEAEVIRAKSRRDDDIDAMNIRISEIGKSVISTNFTDSTVLKYPSQETFLKFQAGKGSK